MTPSVSTAVRVESPATRANLSLGPRIEVATAIGVGRTQISSFDHALWRCGIHNYNLIPLSSVVPPGAEVVVMDRCDRPDGEWGQRLYVVMAASRSASPGVVVAAGLGWAQWGDGRGVFVEHHAEYPDGSPEEIEAEMDCHLITALRDLCAIRQIAGERVEIQRRIATARVGVEATTALAVAVYQAEGWR